MKVGLQPILNDVNIDAKQANSQRQLAISVSAIAGQLTGDNSLFQLSSKLPLNLCLILDHSGSMEGEPLRTVKKAAQRLVERLSPHDRISVVAFDHRAKVIVENQTAKDIAGINKKIEALRADQGTAIDEGIKLGLKELEKGPKESISYAFILTDGENEHGDNQLCIKYAKIAPDKKFTLNALGFGENWNQDILEQIADAGGGTLAYIEKPEQAVEVFDKLFNRMQSVGLTNAYLLFSLMPKVRLAELKPVAQVAPDTIELPVQMQGDRYVVRLGDLMNDARVVLANLYVGQLAEGKQAIAELQVRYDNLAADEEAVLCDPVTVEVNVVQNYQPQLNPEVQQHILALAKYRQTQLAESKLKQGDRSGAATMLQTAAKTALQMGDKSAATVLQFSATRLQEGEELSEADRKKTRIVSKTILQE